MADKQVLVENGRLNAMQQWMLNVSAPLMVAAILGSIGLMLWVRDSMGDLTMQVTVTNEQLRSQIEILKASSAYERATLDSRLTILERKLERAGNRDDN